MTINQIRKLIDRELLVIKFDSGFITPTSIKRLDKEELEEDEIAANYSGINFFANERYPIEEVEIFGLSKIEII